MGDIVPPPPPSRPTRAIASSSPVRLFSPTQPTLQTAPNTPKTCVFLTPRFLGRFALADDAGVADGEPMDLAAALRGRAAAALFLALESATHALAAFPPPVRPKPPPSMAMGADGVRVIDLPDGAPPPVALVGGGGVELPTDLVASSRARYYHDYHYFQ